VGEDAEETSTLGWLEHLIDSGKGVAGYDVVYDWGGSEDEDGDWEEEEDGENEEDDEEEEDEEDDDEIQDGEVEILAEEDEEAEAKAKAEAEAEAAKVIETEESDPTPALYSGPPPFWSPESTSSMPGLANLRSVAIGVVSDTWMDDTRTGRTRHADEHSPDLLCQLLRLPKIESLYMRNYQPDRAAGYEPPNQYTENNLLPPRSSNLKHLWLDNADELGYHFSPALFGAPQGLLTVSFRSGDVRLEDSDQIVSLLGYYQGRTLQSLMFYGPYSHDTIHGYRCTAFRPEEFKHHKALRNVSISTQDIELDVLYQDDDKKEDESMHDWTMRFFVNCFPKEMETLMLWEPPSNDYIKWEDGGYEGLEQAIIKLIKSRKYSNLKAIYLESTERAENRDAPREDFVRFRNAVKVGREEGVDVRTVTNTDTPRHEIEFQEAPDKFSMKTGPWGTRPRNWVFDVYTGRRAPAPCQCAACERCLQTYSEHLWEVAKADCIR
jgi:hypothetical protein